MSFSYYMPSRIFFGCGSLSNLKTAVLPGKKALIITGGTSTTKFGYVKKVEEYLKEQNVVSIVYNKTKPNPNKDNVMECAEICKKEKCDFVIGLGGGSAIDNAKAVAIMATNDGDYWDYIKSGTGKAKNIVVDPLPIIAITTTAGTGTEADPWTVITNEQTNEKIGFGYDRTFPFFSIVDPELMVTIPKDLTAYQGFDALFHSTEGYIANIASPISDLYALKAIELIGKYLPIAVSDGKNIEARENVAFANTLSGFVESTSSCTSEHSMEHALSGFHPLLPHGAGLIMISVEYYKYFLNACPEKFINMAKALGKIDASKPEDFIEVLEKLQKKCFVDDLKMSDYNIDKHELKKYAINAFETMGGLFSLDRVKLSVDDVVQIYQNSYK